MIQIIKSKVLVPITLIGADPHDSNELRLRKIAGVFSVVLGGIPLQGGAGLLLIFLKEKPAGWALVSGASFMFLGIVTFSVTRRFEPHNIYWCALTILSVFLADFLLGGFMQSGLLIIWAILSPLISLITNKSWHVLIWFPLFIIALVLSGLLPHYLHTGNHLSPSFITTFSIFNIIGCGTVFLISLFYFISLNDNLVRELHLEQEKSDALLLNILPKEIAAILKNESRVIADQFDGASILFADVVNFTPLSAQLSPTELVELLNEVFSYLDTLVEKYGLEKIKTIGDCYMAAAGVPRPQPDHASVLTSLALDIRSYVSQHKFRGQRLSFRIGLNSGPVVAGVIGRKKFIYDLWGDAVNTASRMESHGTAGVIQVTEATYELIKNDFVCESHGVINVKGKGEMAVWHVIAKKQ